MELADSLTEIKTVCACGRKATVNARIDGRGRIVTEGSQVLLGGNDPYGETIPRWQCTEQIAGNVLNTFTSPAKADDYRHIIPCIRQYTADNRLLLLGNQASEIFYATETLPYLGNTHLEEITGDLLTKQLNRQEQKYHQLPVVVFLNQEYFNLDEETEGVQEQLKQWMNTHHYKMMVDNEHLTLYQPAP